MEKSVRKRDNIIKVFPKDLCKLKFGFLTVEGLSNRQNGRKMWYCICDCGNAHLASDVNLKRGMVTSCGCNHYKRGEKNPCYTGYKAISGKRWSNMKAGARRRGLDFEITQEYVWSIFITQNNKCAITGLSISFEDKTASVDRIDSKKGYLEGNVHIVHKDINKMKMDFNLDYFIEMCKLITKNNERRNK